MWYARHNLRWNKHAHASVGQAADVLCRLTGLEEVGGMLSTGFARLRLIAPAAMHIRPLRGRKRLVCLSYNTLQIVEDI